MSQNNSGIEPLGRIPGDHSEDPPVETVDIDVMPDLDKKTVPESDRKETEKDISSNSDANPWKDVLDIGLEKDKELIENWKDEMDNLLIFAGLFSAVVTAFTVESYQWLEENPPDPSLALLTRISDQLSSFSTPLGTINSTVASASSITPAPSPASPISSPISINTLWFLSLTLSLISAFYAIAVQQWLRQLTTPRHLLPRDAARLRQWRYDNLMSWQIPSIIAVLPLLIQSAVILFLVGLLLLLQSLKQKVALAFIIVAGVGMIPFLVSVVLPVIFPACPYKSPLIPSVLAIAQWCMVPFVVAAAVLMIVLIVLTAIIAVGLQAVCPQSASDYIDVATDNFFDLLGTVLMYLVMAIIPTTIGLEHFWADRETKALSQKAKVPNELDASALSQALAISAGSNVSNLRAVFHTLPAFHKTRCILYAVTTTIGLRFLGDDNLFRRLVQLVHSETNVLLHDDHTNLIIETLSVNPQEDGLADDPDIAPLSLVLHLATVTDKLDRQLFFPVLINTRAHQSLSENATDLTPTQRVPTVLMCLQLHAAQAGDGISINERLASDMVKWAVENLKFGNNVIDVWDGSQKDLVKRSAKVLVRTVQMIEYILASSAIAFKATLMQQPEEAASLNLADLLSSLSMFLKKARHSRVASAIRSFKNSRHDYMLFAVQVAIEMLCAALADLAESNRIPLDDNSKIIAKTIGDSFGDQDDYAVSKECLDRFWTVVRASETPQAEEPSRFARLKFPKIVSAAKKVLRPQQTSAAADGSTAEVEAAEAPVSAESYASPDAAAESEPGPSSATSTVAPTPMPTRPRLAHTIRRIMKSREYSLASLDADVEKGPDLSSTALPDATVPVTEASPAGAYFDNPTSIGVEKTAGAIVTESGALADIRKPADEAASSSTSSPLLTPSPPFGLLTPELTPMQEFTSPIIHRDRYMPGGALETPEVPEERQVARSTSEPEEGQVARSTSE